MPDTSDTPDTAGIIAAIDAIDRQLINRLQDGVPITEAPYAVIASELGIDESEVLRRTERLLTDKLLTRFGPVYRAERFGGSVTLAAIEVPAARFEEVAAVVNAHDEVAHNYERDHRLNMWFVLAAETEAAELEVIGDIERSTGLEVLRMPKLEEYFLDARFPV